MIEHQSYRKNLDVMLCSKDAIDGIIDKAVRIAVEKQLAVLSAMIAMINGIHTLFSEGTVFRTNKSRFAARKTKIRVYVVK